MTQYNASKPGRRKFLQGAAAGTIATALGVPFRPAIGQTKMGDNSLWLTQF